LRAYAIVNGEAEHGCGKGEVVNATKGYGFIQPDGGGNDVFVRITAVEKAGYTSIAEGIRISFEVTPDRTGKMTAQNLRLG
jgi:cold shock protein